MTPAMRDHLEDYDDLRDAVRHVTVQPDLCGGMSRRDYHAMHSDDGRCRCHHCANADAWESWIGRDGMIRLFHERCGRGLS